MGNNKFVIITPFYNPGEFLERCVSSLITQKYDNYKIIFIDDASTDNSWELLPHGFVNVKCIRNEKNVTALPNIHNAIMNHCEPDDICVLVDGDDSLLNKHVLSTINDFYNKHNCWIMYGQFMFSTGGVGFASAYSEDEYKNVRRAPLRISHIRTFRAGLYHKIKDQDPDFSCMKDKNGKFYRISYDVAMFLPMFEMTPFNKVKFNDKPLYLYNFENPISDHRIDQAGQTNTHIEISKKSSFKQIENYE